MRRAIARPVIFVVLAGMPVVRDEREGRFETDITCERRVGLLAPRRLGHDNKRAASDQTPVVSGFDPAESRPYEPAIDAGPQSVAPTLVDPRSAHLETRTQGPNAQHLAPADQLQVVVAGFLDRCPSERWRRGDVRARSRIQQGAPGDDRRSCGQIGSLPGRTRSPGTRTCDRRRGRCRGTLSPIRGRRPSRLGRSGLAPEGPRRPACRPTSATRAVHCAFRASHSPRTGSEPSRRT